MEDYIKATTASLHDQLLPQDTPIRRYSSPNLTRSQWKTITNLRNDKTIIIKKADKGSKVVVMDLSTYQSEAFNYL